MMRPDLLRVLAAIGVRVISDLVDTSPSDLKEWAYKGQISLFMII